MCDDVRGFSGLFERMLREAGFNDGGKGVGNASVASIPTVFSFRRTYLDNLLGNLLP